MSNSKLPSSDPNQIYVKIAALNGGFVTLPEKAFVTDPDPNKLSTVPSMAFLIEHTDINGKFTRLVFDLGIKRDITKYIPATAAHILHRKPVYSTPDVRSSLMSGNLDPKKDIDLVILSHVHWDHIGMPSDYPNSKFIVGSGTLYILENGAPFYPRNRMESGALPIHQTHELPPVPTSDRKHMAAKQITTHEWKPLATFPNTVDYFGDGSLYIIDAPGHIHAHINALLRVGPEKWVYLGGDCCHDSRIITGEKGIIEYYDEVTQKVKSAHSELPIAKNTIQNIQNLIKSNGNVEWVIAHDSNWASDNQNRFFPNWMY